SGAQLFPYTTLFRSAVERLALLRVDGVAHPEHAADVEHLDDVPGLQRRGHVTGVAEQRLAVAERAGDHVALAELGHAAAGQLERSEEHTLNSSHLGI